MKSNQTFEKESKGPHPISFIGSYNIQNFIAGPLYTTITAKFNSWITRRMDHKVKVSKIS